MNKRRASSHSNHLISVSGSGTLFAPSARIRRAIHGNAHELESLDGGFGGSDATSEIGAPNRGFGRALRRLHRPRGVDGVQRPETLT